jgi:hypothetical protein
MYNSFKPPNRDVFRSAGLHAEDLGDRICILSRYPKNGTCQPGGRVSRTRILFEIMQVATIRTKGISALTVLGISLMHARKFQGPTDVSCIYDSSTTRFISRGDGTLCQPWN